MTERHAHKCASPDNVEENCGSSVDLTTNASVSSKKDGSFLVSLVRSSKVNGKPCEEHKKYAEKSTKRRTWFEPSLEELESSSIEKLSGDKLYPAHGINRELSGSSLSFSSTSSIQDYGRPLDKLPMIKRPATKLDHVQVTKSSLKYGRKANSPF